MENEFNNWSIKKQKIDIKKTTPYIKERDIYWCSIGINIGDEENGKSELFARPVLIFKKFSANLFWGIPLSSKLKDNSYYLQINFKDSVNSIMVSHLRLYDAKRLNMRMGRLSKNEYAKVVQTIINLIPKFSSESLG